MTAEEAHAFYEAVMQKQYDAGEVPRPIEAMAQLLEALRKEHDD